MSQQIVVSNHSQARKTATKELLKTGAAPAAPAVPVPAPTLPVTLVDNITIATMDNWYAKDGNRVPGSKYFLSGAPLGLRINEKTGYLRWTPIENQVGVHSVTLTQTDSSGSTIATRTLTFNVILGVAAPTGIYLAPGGNGDGSAANPFGDLKTAIKALSAGDTLFIRGGLYRNDDWGSEFAGRTKGNMVLININGTETQPITIRNHGNEYVTLESDVTAFAMKRCNWVDIFGIELKGTTNNIDYEKAIRLWWLTDERTNETQGTGIAMNTCNHINVRRCVITDWPGSGISTNYGEYISVEDSVIAHNARWSVGGVHNWSNSKPGTGLAVDTDGLKMSARRNLVIDSQQCIPSRVVSKGFADLKLDEGGGLHTQAQNVDGEGVVLGRWEITDNLVVFCGKSGVNQNETGSLSVERNSFYQNVQNTDSADIHLKPPGDGHPAYGENGISSVARIEKNIIHSLPGKRSINRIGVPTDEKYEGVGENYIVAGGHPANADYVANSPTLEVSQVFEDPANQNFKRHSSIPADFGANDDVIDNIMQMAEEFGVELVKCPIVTDAAYMATLTQRLIDDWPAEAAQPGSDFGPGFELHDPVTGYDYTYANRHKYPNDPEA